MVRAVRRSLALATFVLAFALGACTNTGTEGGARIDQAPVATNDFIPTDQNLTDCVGTVELPNCGGDNPNKGDFRMYLAFTVMVAGLGFIGWRIVVGLQTREKSVAKPPLSTF